MLRSCLVPLLLLSLHAQGQPPGLPDAPTPQPYAAPELRSTPGVPFGSPPLLLAPPPPLPQAVPADRPLPQLEEVRKASPKPPPVVPGDKP